MLVNPDQKSFKIPGLGQVDRIIIWRTSPEQNPHALGYILFQATHEEFFARSIEDKPNDIPVMFIRVDEEIFLCPTPDKEYQLDVYWVPHQHKS